jgi:hypothetical protein
MHLSGIRHAASTIALTGALSLLGIALALHEGEWAGTTVSLLAMLAAVGMLRAASSAVGLRRSRADRLDHVRSL